MAPGFPETPINVNIDGGTTSLRWPRPKVLGFFSFKSRRESGEMPAWGSINLFMKCFNFVGGLGGKNSFKGF